MYISADGERFLVDCELLQFDDEADAGNIDLAKEVALAVGVGQHPALDDPTPELARIEAGDAAQHGVEADHAPPIRALGS